jgi:tetratricopeptide (TPR) repeat protein
VLENEAPGVRFEPLWILSQVAAWQSDTDAYERYAKAALEAAREAERKDLEVLVIQSLAFSYLFQLEIDEAVPLIDRAFELANASGSITGRASAHAVRGWYNLVTELPEEAEADYVVARELFAEIGNSRREAIMLMLIGRAAFAQGHDERAEAILRDAVRTLKGLGDRGSLCEAQRALAMVLAEEGKLDEAERHALEARETVGPEDRVSVGTTLLALGVVRSKQHRDEEAEQLIRESIDVFNLYGLRALEHWGLRVLVEFLRERGRDDEAVLYEERRAELGPTSTARIA